MIVTVFLLCVTSSGLNKEFSIYEGSSSCVHFISEKDKGIVNNAIFENVMSDTEPRDLSVARRQWKAAITRHLGSLQRHLAEGNSERIRERLDTIQASFDEFESVNGDYMDTLTDDTELEACESWFSETEGRYIAGVKSAREWLNKNDPQLGPQQVKPEATDSTSSVASGIDSNNELLNILSIPKLELDSFSGDPLEYPSFIATFDECVGDKVTDDRIKLSRLLQYTSGPAKAAIRNCSLTGGSQGYLKARDILQTRFGNSHLVSRKIINDLTNGKPVAKPADIRQLSDDLAMASAALDSLNMMYEVNNQSTILEIVKRCPKPIQSKWRNKALDIKRDSDCYPDFPKFVEFMTKISTDWCDPVYGGDAMKIASSNYRSNTSSVNTFSAESSASNPPAVNMSMSMNCVACDLNHRLIHCPTFRAMTPANRYQFAKDKRLCFNCLVPNHLAVMCRRTFVCPIASCGKRHSKFLHTELQNTNVSNQSNPISNVSTTSNRNNVSRTSNSNNASNTSNNNNATDVSSASTSAFGGSVYLPILPVLVNGVKTHCLLDNGSTNTFVTEGLAKRLKLHGPQHNYAMRTVTGVRPMSSTVVDVNVSATDNSFSQTLKNVLVNSTPSAKYPDSDIDIKSFPYLSDINLTPIRKGTLVEVVIGMDNAHLLLPLEVRYNPESLRDPYATRTVFGWTLHGHLGDNNLHDISSNFVQLENKVERMWQLDNDLDDTLHSVEDSRVLDLWDSEIKQDNGHYILPIPWRKGYADLPNNKFVAQSRLTSLNKRLEKTGLTEIYHENIKTMINCGYAEPVPQNQLDLNDGTIWYIPHHPVLNKPGKVRPVFDCSARYKGVSLNSECMQGPNLTNNLVDVLLRFRQYSYAIIADIESMYLQIRIPESDRNALRFLWYDKLDGSIMEYRMTSHLFGGIWCASSSSYALRRTVLDYKPAPLIEQTIMKSFYVDDMLKSVPSQEQARDVLHNTKQVLSQGGFNLTKFIVNDQSLLDEIDVDNRAKEAKEIIPDVYCKALGIQWDVSHDTFHYHYNEGNTSPNVTRRHMLSRTMSMYDPLGLVSPVLLCGKLLFQEATRLKLSWDDTVPISIHDKWFAWFESLDSLDDLKFERCLVPLGYENGCFEIHTFCDASCSGYGACTYIRIINEKGNIHVALVASKGRLAPIKQITIPRLELSAAVSAVKLDIKIRNELELPLIKSHFWTDSQIVLAYLRNESKRFKTFVANRVSLIRQHSSIDQWRFVPGVHNPADVLSRGCKANNVPLIWFKGPPFLWDYKSDWPLEVNDIELPCDDPEVKMNSMSTECSSYAMTSVPDQPMHPIAALIEYHSSYYRLQKAVSWLCRIVTYFKRKELVTGPLTYQELRQAELQILRFVQSETFSEELIDINRDGMVRKSSPIYKLSPALHNGLLVVGGRLSEAPMPRCHKSPVILPSNHKITNMIVSEYHGYTHLGTEWVLSRLRCKYWIIKAHPLIKRIKRNCVICKRLYARPLTQRMANLPVERCLPDCIPFSRVGVDIFGPFYVSVGRARVKRYGCIYSCYTSRAVHIEKLDNLTTDSFINCFIRFVSRRGQPELVRSDNGTNLVGAKAELARSFKQLNRNAIIQAARRRDIEWVFNPPLASHHGGLWERMIRTIRRVLCAILRVSDRLTDDILTTVFCDVENIINSRPLTKCSDDSIDNEPLTPNHLLVMKSNYSFPWCNPKDSNMYQRKWRHVQYFVDRFWRRWLNEYLPELQRRQKWLDKKANVRVDDVVMIMDENAPRGAWPLGRVCDVTPGRDGLVRSVTIATKSTKFVRPITKIVLLESTHAENDQQIE